VVSLSRHCVLSLYCRWQASSFEDSAVTPEDPEVSDHLRERQKRHALNVVASLIFDGEASETSSERDQTETKDEQSYLM